MTVSAVQQHPVCQAFDDTKIAGRLANKSLEKIGALTAGLGDKLNENVDKLIDKKKAIEVNASLPRMPKRLWYLFKSSK